MATDFFDVLFGLAGLSPTFYRSSALQRRVPACLRFLRVPTIEEALLKLRSRPALAAELMNVVLLGVTEFNRDQAVFDYLGDKILPQFGSCPEPLRIWSAACSDGRELYSVALMLAHAGLLGKAELLGTDCREDAIRRARDGVFNEAALQSLDEESRRSFFAAGSSPRRVHESVRARIRWKQADLCAAAESGPWDVVLWRNMAIYLEMAAAERVWHSILAELPSGGYLVAGKADHPPVGAHLRRIAPCIYRKL